MVASFTDAWIETQREATDVITQKSHLLQMRGLKLFVGGYADQANLSHLLQMRGLKHRGNTDKDSAGWSHLLQMRGLKLDYSSLHILDICRIFYRCVD